MDLRQSVRGFDIHQAKDGLTRRVSDSVAAEEPLEIRVLSHFKDRTTTSSLAVTMRTPGNDCELAAGFLLSEGVIRCQESITHIRALGPDADSNEVLIELSRSTDFEGWNEARGRLVNSSCGVCGRRSIDSVIAAIPDRVQDDTEVHGSVLIALPSLLRDRQYGFQQTGGLHAAALADQNGRIESLYEDIGRHNALDKLIGAALLQRRLPLAGKIVFMSSRSSFELVQKAAVAGAPVLASVGGPSSLAIELARRVGLTLICFVRGEQFNIYSGEWRIHW